ncbi:hypothetical protein CLI85_12810 [Tannerella forsythia]|nr:hypothetical protein CLI85_12810 [Tannerella forsythia]
MFFHSCIFYVADYLTYINLSKVVVFSQLEAKVVVFSQLNGQRWLFFHSWTGKGGCFFTAGRAKVVVFSQLNGQRWLFFHSWTGSFLPKVVVFSQLEKQ